MITEITNQYNIDLSGSDDNEVPVPPYFTLPNNDWTLSIQVKGSLDGSQYGNLFQDDAANYIFDSASDDTHGRVFGAFNQDYFPIPELEALGEDEWATITITRVGNLLTYYVNGTNYGSITHSSLPTDIETINGWSQGGHHLAPDVANFRVFEGAATAEEVLELVEVPYVHVAGFPNRLFADTQFVVASHRWVGGQRQGTDFLDPDYTAGDGWIYINDDNAVDGFFEQDENGNWITVYRSVGRHALARAHTPDEKIQASAKLIGNGGDVDIVGNTYKLKIMSIMGGLLGEYDAVGTETGVKIADDVGFSFNNSSYETSPFFEIYAEGEIYSDEQNIGINPPLEVVFNVVPNSSELGWSWADTTGSGPQSWYFHDGDPVSHNHLRIGLQYWNGTSWSVPRTLMTWTSGWENLPAEYSQSSPFEIGNYLTEIGWTGVSSQPLVKVTFYNMMNNGADGNVNLTIGESPLVYFWNMETGTVTDTDLEGSSPEAPDTPGDGDSNNGDTNETQPMEEIIMSYSFTNDLLNGSHPTEISCEGDVTEAGTKEVGFEENGCRVKRFLSAVEAKGMRVCGDVKLQGGELFLQDGTAASSLIKEVSMCFGRLALQADIDGGEATELGEFIAMDPEQLGITPTGDPIATEPTTGLGDSEYGSENVEEPAAVAVQGEGKWFLKLLRPSGSATFKEMTAVNNLLTFSNMDGRVQSILEAMQEVEDLQAAVHAAMELKAIASKDDVDALEARLDLEIVHLAQHLTILEAGLQAHIDAGDLAVKTFVEARLADLVTSADEAYASTRFHAEAQIDVMIGDLGENPAPCSTLVFTYDDAGKMSGSRPAQQWLWSVDIVDPAGVMRQDLEPLFTIDPATKQIELDADACDMDDLSGAKFVFNAIYTGPNQPQIQTNPNGDTFANPAYVAQPLPLDPDGADSDSLVDAAVVSDDESGKSRIVAQP